MRRRRACLAGLAAVLALAAGSGCSREPAPPRAAVNPAPVIIIGMDTVRGDHVGAMGGDVATPHLDALAADGVAFTNCQTTAPWTGPAFASLLTGLLPYHHGFLGGDYGRLGEDFDTVAEILLERGYATSSVTTVKWLSHFFGMDQGWQQAKNLYDSGSGEAARSVTGRGLVFARKHADAPFLLFAHYFNAHAPYTPPAPFDGMYYAGDPRAPGTPVTEFLESDAVRVLAPGQNRHLYAWLHDVTDLQWPSRQYAADVAYTDDSVGELIAGLKREGVYDKALIVAVGDHGEHLGEHDFWFTHALPYRETMHVPLIIKFPGGEHAGQTVPQGVSIADVLPTILATLGVAAPRGLDGVDLAPLIGDPQRESASTLMAEQGSSEAFYTKALVADPWKLIVTVRDGVETYELYDTVNDPAETADLAAVRPQVAADLAARLWRLCGERRLTAAAALPTLDINPHERERLRSLGYVH